ncbi:MAG: gliding motility lipoprotein GldH [Bacteroidales bacterium]|nr:gliding motility lipoprotein GldH [Bacteroidales bacterium]
MNKVILFFYLLVAGCLFSCSEGTVLYSDIVDIENSNWHKDSIAQFSFDVTDTTQPVAVRLRVDNSDEYYWANLYLFSTISFPSGKVIRDTLNLIISDYAGRWTGKGIGDKYENTFVIKNNIIFPEYGRFTFSLQQAMRCEDFNNAISGIHSVGIEILEYK